MKIRIMETADPNGKVLSTSGPYKLVAHEGYPKYSIESDTENTDDFVYDRMRSGKFEASFFSTGYLDSNGIEEHIKYLNAVSDALKEFNKALNNQEDK